MKRLYTMCRCLVFLCLLGSFSGCNSKHREKSSTSPLPYYEEATFTPTWFDDKEVPSDFHQIPPFSLQNQLGENITEKTVDGKIFVIDFFFTSCPGICTRMTNNMAIVQEKFANDDEVLLLSHSVTPEYDNVEILEEYAKEKGVISGKWHLLTGARSEIYELGRNYYFVEEDLGLEKDVEDFIHTENFVLIDQDRHIRGIYNGLNRASIAQLITDVKALKSE